MYPPVRKRRNSYVPGEAGNATEHEPDAFAVPGDCPQVAV
jgi:hypothetical protein